MKFATAVLFAILSAGAAHAATAQKPTLVVKTLDDKEFDLSKQTGKWVVVNFWATWCSPCLKELPDISAFVTAHKEKVAGIGLDFEDTEKADVVKFLQSHPLSYPVAQVDPDHPPKDFDEPKGLPNTYVIAPDGHVAKAFLGPITTKDLEAVIAGG
jgi:thiol-disulfide isomerase/thioredoxin